MLAILLSRALSNHIVVARPNDISKTAFDLKYVEKSGKETSLTGGEGFYVAYREYEGGGFTPGEIQLLTYNKQINTNHAKVYFDTMADRDPNNKRVHIVVQNIHSSERVKFDLGIFADANFKTDNDTLSMIHNHRAFEISSANNDGSVVMLIVNGSIYPSVDSLYLGELPHSEAIDGHNYPYWQKSENFTTPRQDSVFAFSWQEREIESGKMEMFGFIAVPNNTYSMEPFIIDQTSDFLHVSGYHELKYEVLDYDNNDKVTVYIEINGQVKKTEAVPFDPKNDKVSKIVRYSIKFEDEKVYKIKVWAVDSTGFKSKPYEKTYIGDLAKKPVLHIDTRPAENYKPKDIITVMGRMDDEEAATLYYQFDNNKAMKYGNERVTSYIGFETFTINVQVPNELEIGKPHNITIWAVDDVDLPSEKFVYTFQLIKPDEPYIGEIALSDERVPLGQETRIVIYGDGTDPDASQVVTVMAKFDNGPATFVGNFTSTSRVEPFAFFYTIYPNATKGRHTVSILLHDDNGRSSSREWPLQILVWDPNAALPPAEVGQILDVSKETIHMDPRRSLFNLHYVSKDGIKSKMTFNDEGYYAAFRVHKRPDGGPASEPHILRYSGESKTNMIEDNFNVTYTCEHDEVTGYMKLKFVVVNNNFFPKLFDLGVFADSDFSGDQDTTIKMRDDGLGMIVTNEKLGIHYTIFTRNVLGSQPVTNMFMKDMERHGTEPMPYDQIPFFNKTDEHTPLKGGNTAYGFSWTVPVNPDEETTFAVLVAAHDKVKTPPRVIDNSIVPSALQVGDTVKLSFEVRDSDLGEKLHVNVSVLKTFDESFQPIVENMDFEFTENGTVGVFNWTYTVSEDDLYFMYRVMAMDMEEGARFTSNMIQGLAFIDAPPSMSLYPLRRHYHSKQRIELSGIIDDPEALHGLDVYNAAYQFTDGNYRSRMTFFPDRAIDSAGRFNFDISIPEEVYPRDKEWGIVIFAVDNYGGRSKETQASFTLNPYNPPVLKRVGLNKKAARSGDKLLGFAVINDKEKQDLKLFAKVGKDSKYTQTSLLTINNAVNTGSDKPVAFYWQVPAGTPSQVADIYFKLTDFDTLDSEEQRVTLIITE